MENNIFFLFESSFDFNLQLLKISAIVCADKQNIVEVTFYSEMASK